MNVETKNLQGILRITIKQGRLHKNTELFGHMDPFILITYQGGKYRTKAISEGGFQPVWEETFEFPVDSRKEEWIKFQCYDEDIIVDDLVGEARFKIDQICKMDGTAKVGKLMLLHNDECAAEVTFESMLK